MSIYTNKKSQQEDYYEDESYSYFSPTIGGKKALKIRSDGSKHYPNKDEASELRRIMSSTGLTEEEVRKIKKYRKLLSKAQDRDQKPKRTKSERILHNLIKNACRVTGLVPQHPETLKALQDILDRRSLSYLRTSWCSMTAEDIVKFYANANKNGKKISKY